MKIKAEIQEGGYETTEKSITVEFKDGWKYVYDDFKPGSATVAAMKELARDGHGLNGYISRVVRANFSRKYG